MTYDEIKNKIIEEIAYFKDENGDIRIPFDLSDEIYEEGLDENSIQAILAAKDPEEEFQKTVRNVFIDCSLDEFNSEAERYALEEYLSHNLLSVIEENDFDITGFIEENIIFEPNLSRFKNQEVNIDIIVDTGDLNYDYTLNSFANSRYYDTEGFYLCNKSALFWLAEQQGLSKEDLYRVTKGESLLPSNVRDLRSHKNNLKARLEFYGFSPFGKSYYYGTAEKYMQAIRPIGAVEAKIEKLNKTIKENSVTIEEFRKRYANNPKIEHITEEYFNILKQRTLNSNYATLEKYHAEIKAIEASIMDNPQFKDVHSLVMEYNKACKEYDEAVKQDPVCVSKALLAESIVDESRNANTGMNALTFCVKMSLEEAMEINKIIKEEILFNNFFEPDKRTGKSDIILSKDSELGLYDFDQGSTGNFGIQLVKDVVLPVKYIDSANTGDYRGFALSGIRDTNYEKSLLSINRVPVKTLENLIEGASKRSGSNEINNDMKEKDIGRDV